MTHDALSDLVLFSVCVYLAFRNLAIGKVRIGDAVVDRGRAGIGIACLVIGSAAILGVIRFSNWSPINERMHGPHRIVSTFAAVGAFPLFAYTLAYPGSPISRQASAAWWLTFVLGGFGLAAWLFGFKLWAQIAPALSGIWMIVSVATSFRGKSFQLGMLGLISLLASFLVTLMLPASDRVLGVFSSTQLFHYLLAAALLLIAASVPPLPICTKSTEVAP